VTYAGRKVLISSDCKISDLIAASDTVDDYLYVVNALNVMLVPCVVANGM
jgi:hypothetical protein